MYPEDEMEDSMNFIERITQMTSRYPNINGILADLLNNIRKDCETEFVYPKLTECLKFITERFNPYYIINFKVTEDQMKLLCAALCLSGKEEFLMRFDEVISIILLRIREKSFTNDALLILNELLSTYYNRYPDAWATLLDRTESIFHQIFPQNRKNVLGCDDDVKRMIKVLETVSKKLPRFCYNEIIKKLIRQCNQAQNQGTLDNFPWDRANIALQTFIYLYSINHTSNNSDNNENVWKSEFSQVKIGDLEFEPMSREISDLIKTILMKICKQFWQSNSNEFIFDANKTKLLKFVGMVLEKYTLFVEDELILRLNESNIEEIQKKAKEVYLRGECEGSDEIIHRIGNMIFGQPFKLPKSNKEFNENDLKVYSFFEKSFNWENKEIPVPPEELQENKVLRGGIFYILESLTSWKLHDPTSSGKFDEKEIELFGKVVDIYFVLLTKYESLVKTVYLEKQNDKNIILRSWSSLVGFRRNSKEIADFLVSILGYSDKRLRRRIIESFKNLPISRVSEFMKLFEKFRLAVSEDFVNLKRNRRNEQAKIEITRVYRNVLISWKMQELTNLTPLRMILRHVIELYYYVSKTELVDEFIWILRGEFCGLLNEYLRIINLMSFNTKKSFLPLKFHLEVWLTVDDWQNHSDFVKGYLEDIEELFVNFSFNLISAVMEVDKTSLPNFIDNLIVKMSRISTNEEFRSAYAYNLLKSSMTTQEESAQLIFLKMVEWIGSGRDKGKKFQEGIIKVLKEIQETSIDGPVMEFFKLMGDDDSTIVTDPEGVLEMFQLISDAKIQRKILNKLRFTGLTCNFNEKLFLNLFELSGKLMETFPNTLRGLWQSMIKEEKNNMSMIVHFLVDKLQKVYNDNFIVQVVLFIYKSIAEIDKVLVLEMLLRYAHPFSGTRKVYNLSPLEAVIKIIELVYDDDEENSAISVMKVLFLNKAEIQVDCYELMKWALECPVNKISSSAWRELKKQGETLSDEFIKILLLETRRFLQHLACPASLKYFDPLLVKEILDFFVIVVNSAGSEVVESIYELAVVQLSAEDSIIFESTCELIKSCLKRQNVNVTIDLLMELAKKPSMSIDLLLDLMKIDTVLRIEKYFCYLIAFLPYIFRLFQESLNLNEKGQVSIFDYSAELEYLNQLIKMNQRIIIEEVKLDEKGNLCLLELGEFLVSIEKQKKRSEIDFYKTIASLLAALHRFTLKLIFASVEEEAFLVYYFDVLRLESVLIPEEEGFRIANNLASSSTDDIIKQRVIDYLIN